MYEEIKRELYEYSSLPNLSDEELERLINSLVLKHSNGNTLEPSERLEAVRKIFSNVRGFGILDELLSDDGISEIMINRFNEIYIEKNGRINCTGKEFESEKDLFDEPCQCLR